MNAATGEQYLLRRETSSGLIEAHVTQVAAGLRGLSIRGIDLVPPYDAGRQRPFASGIVLMPWPNRIRDGRWTLDGAEQQLDLTEPDKNNAIHGLLRFSPYALARSTESSIRLEAAVYPQHGYPFLLDTAVSYELVDAGIEVTHEVVNRSSVPAPVAFGAHPFVTIGDVEPGELRITLDATTRFDVDERLLPFGESPVDGTRFDLRGGVPLAELELDDGFGGAVMRDGISEHAVSAPDGRTVTIWGDASFPYWQVFTTTKYPGQAKAIAIEPMTAPTDAFNSGQELRWLAPGESWTASWGIRADGFAPV